MDLCGIASAEPLHIHVLKSARLIVLNTVFAIRSYATLLCISSKVNVLSFAQRQLPVKQSQCFRNVRNFALPSPRTASQTEV